MGVGMRVLLLLLTICLWVDLSVSAAEPARVATHRLVIVSAEASATDASGETWDPIGSCDLFVRISRRDPDLERQWFQLENRNQQRRVASPFADLNQDPVFVAIVQEQAALAKKFLSETSAVSALRHQWNQETTLQVATGDVLLLQVLDQDVTNHDTVGNAQWRVTSDALQGGKPQKFSFGRVNQLTLEFRPLGNAAAAPESPLSRKEQQLSRQLQRYVNSKIRGADDEAFVLVLVETSWRHRQDSFGDAVRLAAILTDIALFPVLIASRGETSLTAALPPPPPDTIRVDDVRFEVVQGRQKAVDHVVRYTGELRGLPAFPDSMPRVRCFAVLSRHAGLEDAEQAAEAQRTRLEALRQKP